MTFESTWICCSGFLLAHTYKYFKKFTRARQVTTWRFARRLLTTHHQIFHVKSSFSWPRSRWAFIWSQCVWKVDVRPPPEFLRSASIIPSFFVSFSTLGVKNMFKRCYRGLWYFRSILSKIRHKRWLQTVLPLFPETFFIFQFWATLRDLRDLSSSTRNWTCTLGSESMESSPPDCQGIPYFLNP